MCDKKWHNLLLPYAHDFSIFKNICMTFYNPKTKKLIDILNDLIRIHNDRIAGYELALDRLTSLDTDLHDEFDKIISHSKCYKQQLQQKIKELNGSGKMYSPSPLGKIYKAWLDL